MYNLSLNFYIWHNGDMKIYIRVEMDQTDCIFCVFGLRLYYLKMLNNIHFNNLVLDTLLNGQKTRLELQLLEVRLELLFYWYND